MSKAFFARNLIHSRVILFFRNVRILLKSLVQTVGMMNDKDSSVQDERNSTNANDNNEHISRKYYQHNLNRILYMNILNVCDLQGKSLFQLTKRNDRHTIFITGVIHSNECESGMTKYIDRTEYRYDRTSPPLHDILDNIENLITQHLFEIKVYFPFCIFLNHWQLMELFINGTNGNISVSITVDNPCGIGKLPRALSAELSSKMKQRLKRIAGVTKINFRTINLSPNSVRKFDDVGFSLPVVIDMLIGKIANSSLACDRNVIDSMKEQLRVMKSLSDKFKYQEDLVTELEKYDNIGFQNDYRNRNMNAGELLNVIASLESKSIERELKSIICKDTSISDNVREIISYIEKDIPSMILVADSISAEDEWNLNKLHMYFKAYTNVEFHNNILKELASRLPLENGTEIQWRDVIAMSSDQHIKGVKFSDMGIDNSEFSKDTYEFLSMTKNWIDIPDMAVITGPNGSGKTQLLHYIYNNVITTETGNLRMVDNAKVVYIKPTEDFGSMRRPENLYDPYLMYTDKVHLNNFLNNIERWNSCRNSGMEFSVDGTLQGESAKELFAVVTNKLSTMENVVSLDKKMIEKIIQQTIDYELSKIRLEQPIMFLSHMFARFENRRKRILSSLNTVSKSMQIFRFYCEEMAKTGEELHIDAFLDKIAEDETFEKQILEAYVNKLIGKPPCDHFNEILKKYGFKYTLSYDLDKSFNLNTSGISLMYKDKSFPIDSNILSSGEYMMLTMLSWQYYVDLNCESEGRAANTNSTIKIMLLDEPDKHLDPKLCRLFFKIIYDEFVRNQNIQVIMVSHRLDTVALAPENCIFLLEQREETCNIVKVHKLQAMLRMSLNLRDFLDYHFTVYTESLNDKLFYEGVYYSLKNYCDRLREEKILGQKLNLVWKFPDLKAERRLLSNRHQMNFYAVSETKPEGNKGNGGCAAVKSRVNSDNNTLDSSSLNNTIRRRLFSEWGLYKSFGIIDKDYEFNHGLEKGNLQNYIVILPKRHSLETFLYDPLVISSVLENQEIESCNNEILRNTMKNIKQLISDKKFSLLQTEVYTYCSTILNIIVTFYKKDNRNDKQKLIELIEKSLQDQALSSLDIAVIGKHNFVLKYPSIFLIIKGKDIECVLTKKNKIISSDTICRRINKKGLDLIPLDLADVIFNLDEMIRNNVRSIINPYIQ